METRELILLLIPLTIIQIVLMSLALIDLLNRKKVTGGNKFIWAMVIVLINMVGPVLYFVIGRKED